MGATTHQSTSAAAWELARAQHNVITRVQLLSLGFTAKAITHRIARGRLHSIYRGVYAVGRRDLSRYGAWMAAVLACGPSAVLSHESAAALWRIRDDLQETIEVSIPRLSAHRRPQVVLHRRPGIGPRDVTVRQGIPVTTPVTTLVDLAVRLTRNGLESAVSEADKYDLIDPDDLRCAVNELPRRPGLGILRQVLDRRTLVLADSALERRFVPIARRAGLGRPKTRCYVNGFRVDLYWPELGLVVEADGLRYHRTPQQQARDRRRDQVHTAAGLTCLRFTHDQVVYERDYVEATLSAVSGRLRRSATHERP